MRRGSWWGLLLAVLVAGCAAAPTGPAPPPPLPPLTALGPLTLTGDPRAADPCALLDLTAFGKLSYPSAFRGDGIGACRVEGRAGDDRLQAIDATFDSAAATTYGSAEPPERAGTATILRPAPADDVCRRVVTLTDGTLVVFSGRGQAGQFWAADCEAAEQGLRAGLRLLATQGITYTPGWTATTGLAGVDACTALGDPSALLGMTDPPRYPGFGGWRCLVGFPVPGGTAAWLDFIVTDAFTPTLGGPRAVFGTTPAVVSPYAGQFSPGCQALLDRGPVGPPDPTQRQVVRLTVESPSTAELTCARLRTLAADVVGRLG